MKLLEVGSRCGVTGFGRPTWPAIGPLETGKNEVVLSENGWSGCACAIERFRGGDARELAACGVVPAEASPQAGRAALHSVSESATSEPEPVLRSGLSALAPASVLLSRCLAVPLAAGVKPNVAGRVFQMLFPQVAEVWAECSVSAVLRETARAKSRDRVLPAMAAMFWPS